MNKLFLLLLSVLISTQTFAASSALNFGTLGVSGRGMAGTDPVSWTPTFSAAFGTPTNVSFKWHRRGKYFVGYGSFTMGTPGSGLSSISLPVVNGSQLNIDTTATTINTTTGNPGEVVGWCQEGFTAYLNQPILAATSTSTSLVYVGRSINLTNFTTPATSTQLDSGQVVSFYFEVPIQGWTAGGDGNNNAWSGTLSSGNSWTTSGASYADFSTGGTPAVTTRSSSAFTAPTALSASSFGLSVTFPSLGLYQICAKSSYYNSSAAGSNSLQLVDGSGTVIDTVFFSPSLNQPNPAPLCGFYRANSLSATTIKIQGKTNTGTMETEVESYNPISSWTILKIGT